MQTSKKTCTYKTCKNKEVSRKRPRSGSGQGSIIDNSNSSTSQLIICTCTNVSSSRLPILSSGEPMNKVYGELKKMNVEVPLMDKLEEEIERQLEAKAKKTNLTVSNVKNLIKAVITSEDVKTLIDYNLNVSKERPPYEPKLTRAKIRELLAKEFTSAWPLLSPPRKSEIAEMINRELPDDSSDEEYHPQDDVLQSDEESKLDESLIEDDVVESQESANQNISANQTILRTVTSDENIGQRTRSKFSLSETPLEAIEQAFIPPDITTDMYNTHCENKDWLEFLKEFTQPLSDTNNIENVDDENDPEYNVMVDEEHEGPDQEELRMDRAVKISKKELNELMAEVYEYTQNLSSDEEDSPKDHLIQKEINSIDDHANNVLNRLNFNSTYESTDGDASFVLIKNDDENINQEESEHITIYEEQRLLFEQQFKQHIQLLTMQFLLSHGHPFIHVDYPRIFKSLVLYWIDVIPNNHENLTKYTHLKNSIELIEAWEQIINDPIKNDEIKRFFKKEMDIAIRLKKKRQFYRPALHPYLYDLCKTSTAFLYPLLLPICGFISYNFNSSLFESEANLIVFGMDEYLKQVEEKHITTKGFMDMVRYVCDNKTPARTVSTLYHHIKSCQASKQKNPIRLYQENKSLPEIIHYVIPLPEKVLKLHEQPHALLPENWRVYFSTLKKDNIDKNNHNKCI